MISLAGTRLRFLLVLLAISARAATATAQTTAPLPEPLTLQDAIRLARDRRDEVAAARARTRAAEARPAIVSALPDPMISPSLDHLPFMLRGADVSLTIEQQFPLSNVRAHRRAAARADADRLRADADRVTLDVATQAASAFLMLQERRRMRELVAEQLTFARDVVRAADARYAAGTAPQADVLRAELNVARLEGLAGVLVAEVRAAESMLNASLGRDADAAVPALAPIDVTQPLPSWTAVEAALRTRPELAAGRAEIARAAADVDVMRDMFRPMATIRTGPAYTMTDGRGWMAMVGISLPIWRSRLRAGVAEAEAMRAMSEADLRAMARMIEGEAAAALSTAEAGRARYLSLTRDVLPRARLAIDPTIAGYASGRLPLVSVIEAVQALWLAQADLVEAEIELGLAWARLARAIGSYEGILR